MQTAVNGAGGSDLYDVNTGGKTIFQMNGSTNFIASLQTSNGMVGGGQAKMTPLAYDSTMIFMATASANINKKLDTIKEMQQEMMSFLVMKEKSELKGRVILSDHLFAI